ncbi:TPA: hypothetical protein I7141_19155 [Vibrio vulnificus]|uniref:hypothetical protein n=1 Tax=Vibrio TaxID=662 RepID=UPI001A1CA4B1|nr:MULTISPECIES: hypothetical protein [Vibrio]HAS6077998.1 hypothetical protein [Vibrio vulnificus]MDF5600786.1 hypothetical protein [Vibrio parahaemolyticus]MDW2094054.1 hypothetical protein [Vibrio sp. 1866]MDW3103731.1 hypothetical protein [Vibrio sp. 1874]MDW3201833.1 hypothetical protein [Vibrio sp. 1865]
MSIEVVEAVKVFRRKVWIESDITGAKHVMIQHDDGVSKPFTYCSFFYDYAHTSNANIKAQAEAVAHSLGANYPIEDRTRSLEESFKRQGGECEE